MPQGNKFLHGKFRKWIKELDANMTVPFMRNCHIGAYRFYLLRNPNQCDGAVILIVMCCSNFLGIRHIKSDEISAAHLMRVAKEVISV